MLYQTQKGNALVEFAFVLPILLMLLLGVAEVGNMLNAYLTVVEASREGARLVLSEGPSANVQGLVNTLTARLPPPLPKADVNPKAGPDPFGNQFVTVEVTYDYHFILGDVPLIRNLFPDPLTLSASTSMALP